MRLLISYKSSKGNTSLPTPPKPKLDLLDISENKIDIATAGISGYSISDVITQTVCRRQVKDQTTLANFTGEDISKNDKI